MADKIIVSKSKVTNLFDSIRAKSGSTDLMSFDTAKSTVDDIQTGSKPNIHYSSTEAPTDTTQLWVKADIAPSKVGVGSSDLPFSAGTQSRSGSSEPSITVLDTVLPEALIRTIVEAVDDKIYILGGSKSGNRYSNIYEFDILTKTLTTLSVQVNTPVTSAYHSVVEGKIYIFGGLNPNATNIIQVFDTKSQTFTLLNSTLPKASYNGGACSFGNKIYLFGGSNAGTTILEFDTETQSITTLDTVLEGNISNFSSLVVGNEAYIISGYNSSSIQVFDLLTKSKTKKGDMESVLYGYISGAIGEKIYILGGQKNYNTFYQTIKEYDTKSNTFKNLDITLPERIVSSGFSTYKNKIYIFGGEYTGSASNKILEFDSGEIISYFLQSNNLYIQNNLSTPQCKLINSDSLDISIGVEKCYLGNSENVAEEQTIAIHNGTEWQEI